MCSELKTFIVPDKEVRALYRLAQKHPGITFLFAHSMYSSAALRSWHQWELHDGKTLNNVWIEISTFYQNVIGQLYPDLTDAWREFGLNRILFGSDLAANYQNADEVTRLIEAVQNSDQLTLTEKRGILNDNGKRLLKNLGITR
jgi:predicted TIM-barrel fold metal-dependent hydrolase